MKYMVGDLVELRNGQRVILEKHGDSKSVLQYKTNEGGFCIITTNGDSFTTHGGFRKSYEESLRDVVKLIQRPINTKCEVEKQKQEKKLEDKPFEYKAGDTVRIRDGKKTTLTKNQNSIDFPLCYLLEDGCSRSVDEHGRHNWFSGTESIFDVVELISRPKEKTSYLLPCGLTKLEYFMLHLQDTELPIKNIGEEILCREKKDNENWINFYFEVQANWKLRTAKAMLKAIEEDKSND